MVNKNCKGIYLSYLTQEKGNIQHPYQLPVRLRRTDTQEIFHRIMYLKANLSCVTAVHSNHVSMVRLT